MSKAWKDIRNAMLDSPDKTMPERDAFWEDFRAQTSLRNQEAPREIGLTPTYRWSLAVACAILLFVLVGVSFVWVFGDSADGQIKSLNIMASHSAVVILNEYPEQATIVWVVDMKIDDTDGTGT